MHSLGAQQLSSMLQTLHTLEREWAVFKEFLDNDAGADSAVTPQLSALVEQVNSKGHHVHNLLAAVLTHGQKRARENDNTQLASSNETEKRLRLQGFEGVKTLSG